MSTAFGSVIGGTPGVLIAPVVRKEPVEAVDTEQMKYKRMWEFDQYRAFSPGEVTANQFLNVAKPSPGEHVIDFGTGTGRGAFMLALMGRMKVTMVDFADNCLDPEVKQALTTQSNVLDFVQGDLRKPIPVVAKYGYCTDVMEHLPPEDVDAALHHILKSAQHVFFQISTLPDSMGALIGEELHLTIQPYEWWLAKMKEHEAVVMWAGYTEGTCSFYVSAWQTGSTLVSHGVVNTEAEAIRENIRSAMNRNLQEVRPYEKNDIPVIILAGGPSMNDFKDEIIAKRAAGAKLITVNGAYNWALENGITPSGQIVVDAREFNSRFVQPAVPDCKYLLASQCHPATFDSVPADQTILWHSAIDEEIVGELEAKYTAAGVPWYPIMGGSTVMLRALPLLVLLGYSKFEIYGFDSCLKDGEHHSYVQVENDHVTVLQVLVAGKSFACHPWMASQAQEFLDLMQLMAEHIELDVHGDGLISWLIKTASGMDDIITEVDK